MKLTFLGATGTVTGSKYLIEHADKKVLIDCGMFQGHKELRLRNWAKLPVDPATIDAVILTHAHIDHSGYVPLLVKNGFRGTIYCTEATYSLCTILLPDSGYLHEEDAKRANKYNYSKHNPALPLYTKEEALDSLKYFKTTKLNEALYIDDKLHFTLEKAGHILGSAFVILSDGNKTVTFSGDLGRPNSPIMRDPTKILHTDYLLIESTYGDRLHNKTDPSEQIKEIINSTSAKGGTVLIPSFAVGRAQKILYYIYKLKEAGEIPDIPVFLDSPMSINVTELLCKFDGEHRLSHPLCKEVCNVASYTRTPEESKAINDYTMPSIIISASGMATGGRVLHHLKNYMSDFKNTILFAGFQAGGTRGDRMLRGEKSIKIHGEMHPLRARVENLDSISAHADYAEILQWLATLQEAPKKVFITHGEPKASLSLKEKIETEFGWNVVIPEYLQKENL
jgi:metallo-beta-lactamase family protein